MWFVLLIHNSFRLDVVDGDSWELQLNPDGDLTIKGSIVTAGSCSAGCGRVFAPDYPLPTIEEHAAAMWDQQYLPAVGPTSEGEPINLSDKTEGMHNKLEKAHIYIEQLHGNLVLMQDQLDQMQEYVEQADARMREMQQRVDLMEARLGADGADTITMR